MGELPVLTQKYNIKRQEGYDGNMSKKAFAGIEHYEISNEIAQGQGFFLKKKKPEGMIFAEEMENSEKITSRSIQPKDAFASHSSSQCLCPLIPQSVNAEILFLFFYTFN